jgi:hypothetical protein
VLCLCRHCADIRYAFVVARALVIAEEEGAVLKDRTTDESAELIALERGLAGSGKIVRSIQRAVTEILEGATMKGVGS